MKISIKSFLVVLITTLLSLTPNMSFAVEKIETYIPSYVSVTYPITVTLKSIGCQNITFSYAVDEDLPLENTVWLVQIVHSTKNAIYGGNSWFSTLTYMGDKALPPLPRAGVRSVKVCRKTWVEGKGANKQSVPGIKPGKYRLYFAGVTLDPVTGSKIGEKTEVYKTIVFK